MTKKVKHQIQLLTEDFTLQSLWKIPKFLHLGGQGTSQNESLHSIFSKQKSVSIGRASLEITELMIGIMILEYHERYNSLQILIFED